MAAQPIFFNASRKENAGWAPKKEIDQPNPTTYRKESLKQKKNCGEGGGWRKNRRKLSLFDRTNGGRLWTTPIKLEWSRTSKKVSAQVRLSASARKSYEVAKPVTLSSTSQEWFVIIMIELVVMLNSRPWCKRISSKGIANKSGHSGRGCTIKVFNLYLNQD